MDEGEKSRRWDCDWRAIVVAALVLAAVTVADMMAGPDVTLGPLYLVPVGIVAWWGGAACGAVAGVAAGILWLIAQLHGGMLYHSKTLVCVNAAMRTVFNIALAIGLSAWRGIGLRLERMVVARTAALHDLAANLSAAEDAQRRQLAHDIHDALGQNLSLLRIHLESLAREHALEKPIAAEVQRIDELIRQTRNLTFDLYPAMLDDLGLAAALEGYADEFIRRTGARVTVSQSGPAAKIETPIAHFLFRSVRELMNNAVKHGGAKEIVITLHWQNNLVRLAVDDDGSGFDAAAPRRGLGLAAIRQRLVALDGEMQIESQSEQGARAILRVPLKP